MSNVKPLLIKIAPTRGFSSLLHYIQVILLPLMIFILVRLNAVPLALVIVVLAKWRMLAVRPRFWPANIRANAVDIMVGFSAVVLISQAANALMQLVWVVLYGIWLLIIKPRSAPFWVSLQAGIAQLAALSSLYLAYDGAPLVVLSLLTGLICYLAGRHFFDSFDEAYGRLLSYSWGYVGAALAWLLGHWLLYYQFISQPTLLLSVIGYGLAGLYYLDHYERLNTALKRRILFVMLGIILVVVTFSDWGDKVV